jgi:hypothetical protein
MRQLARELDDRLGSDRSVTIFEFEDGWTIRRVSRLDDQWREGELMKNCLRGPAHRRHLDRNCFSLRDAENLPHASFTAWRAETDNDYFDDKRAMHASGQFNLCYIVAADAFFVGVGVAKLADKAGARTATGSA